jgi:hypothetical protein
LFPLLLYTFARFTHRYRKSAAPTPASPRVARDASHRAIGVALYAAVIRVRLRLVAVRARVADDAREHRIVRRGDVAIGANGPMVRHLKPRVVEGRAEPIGCGPGGVAGDAGSWVLRRDVVRHTAAQRLRALPRSEMATITIRVRRRQAVVAADVARSAGRSHVGAGQRPTCGAVIKLAVGPVQSVVAGRALGRGKSRSDVIRHIAAEGWRALPRSDVATVAIRVRRGEGVVVPDVAIGASHDLASRCQLMRTRQRPPGHAVVKNRGGPRDRAVAGRTVRCRKGRSRGWMNGIICSLPSGQVALRIPAVCRRNR